MLAEVETDPFARAAVVAAVAAAGFVTAAVVVVHGVDQHQRSVQQRYAAWMLPFSVQASVNAAAAVAVRNDGQYQKLAQAYLSDCFLLL